MIVDTATGEVVDVKRRMKLRDLNRPKRELPSYWASKRRPRRQSLPLADVVLGLTALVLAAVIVSYL